MNIETKYFVNEEKRTVVCTLETYEGKFTGIAKCDPEDMFVKELGMRIANYRAHIAMHQFERNEEIRVYDLMVNKVNRIAERANSHGAKIENLKEQLSVTLAGAAAGQLLAKYADHLQESEIEMDPVV